MLEFQSAQQMFEHLATYITDEDTVVQAVQKHFPCFRKSMSRRASSPNEQWASTAAHDLAARKNVDTGSKDLLHAIHREHPRVMARLAAQGRQVVYP